jgi:hypothetical protein
MKACRISKVKLERRGRRGDLQGKLLRCTVLLYMEIPFFFCVIHNLDIIDIITLHYVVNYIKFYTVSTISLTVSLQCGYSF